jgi:hypothetical protein
MPESTYLLVFLINCGIFATYLLVFVNIHLEIGVFIDENIKITIFQLLCIN